MLVIHWGKHKNNEGRNDGPMFFGDWSVEDLNLENCLKDLGEEIASE